MAALADGAPQHVFALSKMLGLKPQQINGLWQQMPPHIRGLLRQHDGQWRLVRPLAVFDEARVQQIAAASAAVKHKGRVSMLAKLHPKTTTAGKASKIRMDLDNCIKVACDALQGVLYDNDRQIERISIEIGGQVIGGALSVEVLAISEGVA